MTTPNPTLLFHTDAQNQPASFLDVVADGLDGGLDARIPALLQLLHAPGAESALKAAVMLISWGRPEAFRALETWTRRPGRAPWAGQTITTQRHSGGDGSWSLLADALRTSRYAHARPGLDAERLSALRCLLRLTRSEDFDRSLATTIASIPGAAGHLADDLDAAIRDLISSGPSPGFDTLFQAALLSKELARTRPGCARALAQQLATQAPSPRAQRELDDLL